MYNYTTFLLHKTKEIGIFRAKLLSILPIIIPGCFGILQKYSGIMSIFLCFMYVDQFQTESELDHYCMLLL